MNDFTEKRLEDIIFENKENVTDRGFPFLLKKTIRQFILPSGKKIDLFSFDISEDMFSCRIYELKKEELTLGALTQILEYSLEVYTLVMHYFNHINIEKFLIGRDIDTKLLLTNNHLVDVEVYLFKYEFNGIFFSKYRPIWEVHEKIMEQFPKTTETDNFYARLKFMLTDNEGLTKEIEQKIKIQLP